MKQALSFIKQIHRSMIGQMLILSLLLISSSIYYVAYVPISDLNLSQPDPYYYTVEKIRREIREFIDTKHADKNTAEKFEFSKPLKEFMSQNPNFRYFILFDGQSYSSNGFTPRYYSKLQLDTLDKVNHDLNHTRLCTNFFEPTLNDNDHGYIQYSYCNGESFYLEFTGITVAEMPPHNSIWLFYKRMVVDVGAKIMLPAMGVFIITFIILLFNWRLMNKIAKIAYSFNPKNLHHKLPEKGLPNEVLPLVQAVNEMLARIDETQKQHNFFLSTAAHEIRTPITVLRTRLEMMDECELKEKLIDDVRRLYQLVNQLLRLMRIGGPKSHDTYIDLVQCCERVITERSLLANNAQVSLLFNSEKTTIQVLGDEGLVEIAIANLVDNAISFSQPGQTVEICVCADYSIIVRDQGPGVPVDKLNNLFVPFAKFPPNRNGHGLGLAIVKAIAQLHSGSINAENSESGGALFTLQLKPNKSKPI